MTVYTSPIYYVGQPIVTRTMASPHRQSAWLKSTPITTQNMHAHRCSRSPSRTPSPPPTTHRTRTHPALAYSPSRSPTSPRPASASSDVPTAVSTLLGLTKQLQDVLRLWSLRQATETQVSDAFVLVGMQFDATCAAFARCGVDMSDLYEVPTALRAVLETCLGEQPSPRTAERYMPEVRRVLYGLACGLKEKQGPYWRAVEEEQQQGRSAQEDWRWR